VHSCGAEKKWIRRGGEKEEQLLIALINFSIWEAKSEGEESEGTKNYQSPKTTEGKTKPVAWVWGLRNGSMRERGGTSGERGNSLFLRGKWDRKNFGGKGPFVGSLGKVGQGERELIGDTTARGGEFYNKKIGRKGGSEWDVGTRSCGPEKKKKFEEN